MQRRRPPEAALAQAVRGYAEHPLLLSPAFTAHPRIRFSRLRQWQTGRLSNHSARPSVARRAMPSTALPRAKGKITGKDRSGYPACAGNPTQRPQDRQAGAAQLRYRLQSIVASGLRAPCKAKSGWNWLERQHCPAAVEPDDTCASKPDNRWTEAASATGQEISILVTIRPLPDPRPASSNHGEAA